VIAYPRTNKLVLVGDQQFIGSARAIIAQLDEKADPTRSGVHVYYLENAEAEGLATTLNLILTGATQEQKKPPTALADKLFGGVTITADKPTNALIVNASAEDYNGIKGLIGQLDIKRKQVFVEALILEVSMDALLEIGTSLQGAGVDSDSESVVFGTSNQSAGGSPQLAPIPSGSLLTQAVEGILLGGLFNPITTEIFGETVTIPALSALIRLSQSDNDVNVLSAPRLLTSDNEEAEIVVGSNVPIITSKSKDNDGNPINSVERKDVALTLRFTPQITEGDLVRLKIYQEISDVAPSSQTVGTVDEVGPTFNTRKLRNSIVARDGKTVVLGGLFQTNHTEIRTKIPLLGDIPVLGQLFRSKKDSEKKTSLLIFITPRVIRSSEDLERITRESQANLDLFHGKDQYPVFNPDPAGQAETGGPAGQSRQPAEERN
jgi:general secretion pathway protein D